jgi:hypothetical protein
MRDSFSQPRSRFPGKDISKFLSRRPCPPPVFDGGMFVEASKLDMARRHWIPPFQCLPAASLRYCSRPAPSLALANPTPHTETEGESLLLCCVAVAVASSSACPPAPSPSSSHCSVVITPHSLHQTGPIFNK